MAGSPFPCSPVHLLYPLAQRDPPTPTGHFRTFSDIFYPEQGRKTGFAGLGRGRRPDRRDAASGSYFSCCRRYEFCFFWYEFCSFLLFFVRVLLFFARFLLRVGRETAFLG
jgi:hypothetical protein